MSRWRHGCDVHIAVFVPHRNGYDYVERIVRCGSTAHDGGVNQCAACYARKPMPAAREDESDSEYAERTEGD